MVIRSSVWGSPMRLSAPDSGFIQPVPKNFLSSGSLEQLVAARATTARNNTGRYCIIAPYTTRLQSATRERNKGAVAAQPAGATSRSEVRLLAGARVIVEGIAPSMPRRRMLPADSIAMVRSEMPKASKPVGGRARKRHRRLQPRTDHPGRGGSTAEAALRTTSTLNHASRGIKFRPRG